jgi:hypothetical protein
MKTMELRFKRKILLLILAACIAFSVVFAETLTTGVHEHDCIGEGCPVCLCIEAAECFLKTLKVTGTGLFLAACSVFPGQFHKNPAGSAVYSLSPVLLKVRFNS